MQEDIEQRAVTLIVNSSKFSGRTLKAAIAKFLGFSKRKLHNHFVEPKGKQSVKKLMRQNAGVSSTELGDDADMKQFDRLARKYGVDYAVKRIEKDGLPQHLIFFKAKDADAIRSVMEEFAGVWKDKGKEERPSIRKLLASIKSLTGRQDKERNKEISR